MTDWKKGERKLAAVLGGVRVPVTGRARGTTPDIAHEWLSVEVKCRLRLPAWLHAAAAAAAPYWPVAYRAVPLWLLDALDQAGAAASADDGKLPIVILHEHGRRYVDAIVCATEADIVQWAGNAQGLPATVVIEGDAQVLVMRLWAFLDWFRQGDA